MTKFLIFAGAIAALVTGNGDFLLLVAFFWWCGVTIMGSCKSYPHHRR